MGSTPLALRCPKCKVGEDYRRLTRGSSAGLERTGRERTWGEGDTSFKQVEVRHRPCGWVFWTTHDHWTGNRRVVARTMSTFGQRMRSLRSRGVRPVETDTGRRG